MSADPEFRKYLRPLESARLADYRGMDALAYGKAAGSIPIPATLLGHWATHRDETYQGITCDGHIERGLFQIADEGAPSDQMLVCATALLDLLEPTQRKQLMYPIEAVEWRRWSNPEFLANPNGLRLEDIGSELRVSIMRVLEASLSAAGYEKARGCMKTNAFLGRLCELPLIMNEWSYNFLMFGEPSLDKPWGWSFYGHHLVLNCFVLGRQMVISPTFMGAEPNFIDSGPEAGLRLFDIEESGGLALMRSLTPDLRKHSTIYSQMLDPAMPKGRWHPGDQRHLGGAFQDNRIIPYEGIQVSAFTSAQKRQLMDIVTAFIGYLPAAPLGAKLSQVEAELDRTYWSWIGGHGEEDPFYYRVQSPVLMVEFDHHSGVWLGNLEPAKCHIHTVVRTPNGNDYGKDLLRQHYDRVHQGHTPGMA